ncbi:MAG: efflux RND transporter periplasmic adaptor subunit [Pseudomonadota bacterium]
MSPPDTPVPPAAPRGLRSAAIVAALVLLVIVAIGLTTRARSSAELRAWTEENAVPTVAVVAPQPLAAAATLQLPGRLEAYARASIYARAGGYLKRWHADIGAAVKAGQVLAEIETPELDQQLAQARADLLRAEADAELARLTAERWQSMRGTDAVSKQEIDEKVGDAAAKAAAVRSAQANLDRLIAMQGFQRVLAPFDGIITARNTDVGALIVAGGGEPLFTIADTRRLRLYVQVPQVYMPSIEIGQAATVTVPEHPGRVFTAKIDRSARAVSAGSGGTLVQMVVGNADGALLPGGYADVSIELPGRAEGAAVPASALIFDADGVQVAVVGEGDKVLMKPVTIVRDLGKVVEVSGVAPGDRLIDSPPDSLLAGDVVRLAADHPEAPKT